MEDNFVMDPELGGQGAEDGFRMTQGRNIYCVLCF